MAAHVSDDVLDDKVGVELLDSCRGGNFQGEDVDLARGEGDRAHSDCACIGFRVAKDDDAGATAATNGDDLADAELV